MGISIYANLFVVGNVLGLSIILARTNLGEKYKKMESLKSFIISSWAMLLVVK